MKILKKDLKKQEIKIRIDSADDLWFLSQIIEPGDALSGKTLRKIRIGDSSDSNTKVIRKPVFLELKAEKIEFTKGSVIRATGKITHGPEDVPLGSYHSFNIEEGTDIKITKERWLGYQIKKIKEAENASNARILLVIFDREDAHFALLKNYGYEYLSGLHGSVQKKAVDEKVHSSFYKEIITTMQEYDKRFKLTRIVLSSPSFWKEELQKELSDEALKKKIIPATSATVAQNAFDELLRRPEVQQALRDERAAGETELVEDVLEAIAKEGPVAYGLKEVAFAAQSGAVEKVMVCDTLLAEMKEAGSYDKVDRILRNVDTQRGHITIVSHEHEGGRKLSGLGGIAAILRYHISR